MEKADRAAEMCGGSYPGEDEIQYYAKVLGGTIIVRPKADDEYMIPLVYGDEPLMLEVTHVRVADEAGHESGHFELAQVWHAAAPQESPAHVDDFPIQHQAAVSDAAPTASSEAAVAPLQAEEAPCAGTAVRGMVSSSDTRCHHSASAPSPDMEGAQQARKHGSSPFYIF